jgi:hypothetical protein
VFNPVCCSSLMIVTFNNGLGWQIATTTSVSLANQNLVYLSGSHAELGQFSERSAYIDVVKQIWDITGPQAIGRGCIIVHNPTNAQIE